MGSSPFYQQYTIRSNNPYDLWPHVDRVHYAFLTRGEDGNVVVKDLEGFVAMSVDDVKARDEITSKMAPLMSASQKSSIAVGLDQD